MFRAEADQDLSPTTPMGLRGTEKVIWMAKGLERPMDNVEEVGRDSCGRALITP